MSSLPINSEREKMNLLLERLERGALDREGAAELKPLLQKEMQKARQKGHIDREYDLQLLIDMLDSYMAGHIDLMVMA
jgi:hypothetical protein